VRAISDTNTAIYSVAFSSNRAEERGAASKLEGSEPGPEHGCFSHDSKTDKVVKDDGTTGPPEESKGTQYFDCAAQLAPPLILARMAELAVRNLLRKNISEAVAKRPVYNLEPHTEPVRVELSSAAAAPRNACCDAEAERAS
jgi:hypothetical protein